MAGQSGNKQEKAMSEQQCVQVLTVKAVEENAPGLLAPMAVSSANIYAIGAKRDRAFIAKRAAYLFKLLPEPLKNLAAVHRFPGNWLKITLLLTFVIGLLSNYLGPSQMIHVVYNPITILLLWNVLVYLFFLFQAFWHIRLPRLPESKSKTESEAGHEAKPENKKISSNFLVNWLLTGIYKGIVQLKSKYVDGNTRVLIIKKVIPAFWAACKEVGGRAMTLRAESLLNTGAIGLLFGALVGIYFRGLFFRYNIVWQSTFVSDPETVRTMLNILFGPAGLLIDGQLIPLETVRQLMEPGGASAGPWIHKMALTTLLFIFVPRTILAIYFARKAKRSFRDIQITQPYYTEHILKNRGALIGVIREGIREIISKKIGKTAHTIAEFVIRDYYEKIIAPILVSFREKGGRIRDLEKDLFDSQEKFEPILLKYLREVQEDFRESVLTEINLFLGRKLVVDISTVSTYQPRSDEIDRRLPGKLAADIGDTIGGTIVTTVALAVGSVSGGIGKSLGIAIISGLLGVSGPVGLLIGGVITAVTLGGVYKLKREQISGMIKDVPLPAFVISATLTDARIEKARKETYSHTEMEIRKMLEPKIDEVTDAILKDIAY